MLFRSAEAVRLAVEAVACGAVTPSEAETVLKLLESLRAALIDQKDDRDTENWDQLLKQG